MKFPRPDNNLDAKALEQAMEDFRVEWGFVKSFKFDDLLRRWAEFVEEVERGYSLSLEDFTHALALRDSIDDIVLKMASGLLLKIKAWLEPWDHRFRFATREIKQPLLPIENNERFWWWRLPNVLQGELLDAALAEHLI